MVRHAQGVRYYTMFSAMHLLSWWLYLRALKEKRPGWVGYGAAAGVMLLTNPFGWVTVAVQTLATIVLATTERIKPAWLSPQWSPASLLRGIGVAAIPAALIVVPWYAYGISAWLFT